MANVPLTIVRGDTFRKRLTLRSKVTVEPVDLTGWTRAVDSAGRYYWTRPLDVTDWTFAAQVRATVDAASALVAITVTVIDAEEGIIELVIVAATTATLPLTTARPPVWDLQATKSDGDIWTPLGGKVSIVPDATRP